MPANAGDAGITGSIPGLGIFLEGGNGNQLQYACLLSGQKSLISFASMGCKESDMTEPINKNNNKEEVKA